MHRYLLELAWDPSGLKRRIMQLQLARMPPTIRMQFINSMKRGVEMEEQRLQQRETLLKMAAARRLLKAKLEAMMREQAKQAEMLTKEMGEFLEMDSRVIAKKLRDQQPITRWLAAMVAGRKRLHLETDLIALLSDHYPQVREAAREALIRLSRGNDFGPLPKTTAKQVARSIRAWRAWYNLQDPPETVPEYLAPPQLAEADRTPVWERLPRPQPAKAEVAQH